MSFPTLTLFCRYAKILNMLGIIVALPKEAENLLNNSKIISEKIIAGKKFYQCKIKDKIVIIAISNVGKVASSMTAQILIDKFSPDKILNFGSVGGIKEKVSALEICLVEKCCQYDFDLSAIDNCEVCYNQNYSSTFLTLSDLPINLKKVSLATSDKFTHTEEQISIINKLGCDIYDMEGSAIAQVCNSNNIPLFMIKGVTDVYGSGLQGEQFLANLTTVGKLISEKVLEFIKKI